MLTSDIYLDPFLTFDHYLDILLTFYVYFDSSISSAVIISGVAHICTVVNIKLDIRNTKSTVLQDRKTGQITRGSVLERNATVKISREQFCRTFKPR